MTRASVKLEAEICITDALFTPSTTNAIGVLHLIRLKNYF